MDYFRSLLGQKPTPLAAFRNNPANRNESQRRRVMLNRQRAQRIINNNAAKAITAQKATWANQVRAANAARQLSEQTRKVNRRFTPTLESIAESNTNLPTPLPAPNGVSKRAQNAAQVALPENQNNIIRDQRKAARERKEPNIWNMNEGRSLFQLGPNARPAIRPPVSPPIANPAISPSGYPFGVVPSSSRKNKRLVSHNTTPGLARAQAANAAKRHARFSSNVGSNQNKKMPTREEKRALQLALQQKLAAEAAARGNNARKQALRESRKLANNEAARQRGIRNAGEAVAAGLPPMPELAPLPTLPSGPSEPLEVPVLPGRSNLGLPPPGFLGAVPPPPPLPQSAIPPLPPRRSRPSNQGAADAAAFARELNEAAAAAISPIPAAAPPAIPQFNGSVRGTNLARANAENQPKPRKQFIVAPYQNAMSASAPILPPPPPPAGFKGIYPAASPGNPFAPSPGNPFGFSTGISPSSTPANSNALTRVRLRANQRANNLAGAANANRQNTMRRAAAKAAAQHFANEAQINNIKKASNANAKIANIQNRLKNLKSGTPNSDRLLAELAAAQAELSLIPQVARNAASMSYAAKTLSNPISSYTSGSTNLQLPSGVEAGCSPCEVQILGKLDLLLDRSKPSTLVSNALASGKKTIQSAIAATLLGLKLAMEQGTAGATTSGEALMAAAFRSAKAVLAAGKKVDEAATNAASELMNAARIAKNCVKGASKGANRSERCAAAYAAVQKQLNELQSFLTPPHPPLPWPITLTFPKINYFTVKNAKNGKTQFQRNVNRTRGALGRFGNRISRGLGAFGASLKNASGRASSALSRGTLGARNYLSGRTKERARILNFIKRSYYNRGIKKIDELALERQVRALVATGMSPDDARTAVINTLGGLNMGPNGKVTATDGLSLSQRAAQAEANFARAASEVAVLPPGAAAQSVVNSQQAPFIKSSNRAKLESFLANETEPQTFQYKGTQGAPLGLQPRARVGSIPGLPLAKGGRSRKNRSRKNRKGSRKH